jgi:hypothetical protein
MEVNLRKGSDGKYPKGEALEASINVSGEDSFRREKNDSRPSYLGETHGGYP